jgi:poly-beta-hydroxyalkanoate depolymerase
MSMNPQRHQEALKGLYDKRVVGEDEAANRTAEFYAEYFAVNDLPAEFYLETVAQVFQEYTLAKGEMVLDGSGWTPRPSAAPRCSRWRASATTSAPSARRWRPTTCARASRPI